jgi:hypothetical protein
MVLLVLSCPVDEELNVSCRRLALRIDVSSFTIWRTLHEQGLHPYHLQRVQHLKSKDPPSHQVTFLWGHLKQIVYETPVDTEAIRQNSDILI